MSYILDALQRSDNERTVSHVPTLGSGRRARRRRRTDWRRTLVGILAIGLVLLFLAFWFRTQIAGVITGLRSDDAAQTGVAANAPPPPRPQTATPQATQAPVRQRTRTETVRIPVPEPAPRQRAPAQRITAEQPAPVQEEVFSSSTGQMAPAVDQGNTGTSEPLTQPAAQPAIQTAATPTQPAQPDQEQVEDSDDLPSNVRRDLPQMQLNVVSYSSNPEKRFVMIDQKILREGDSAPGGMTIEEITSDGPIMAWRGRRFLMRP